MKFTKVGSNGNGSSRTPLDTNELLMIDRSLLEKIIINRPTIKNAWEFEKDKRDKLEMLWYYVIAFRGSVLITFHAEQSYYIDWDDITATDEDLKSMIIDSYKHLQNSFLQHIEEYIIFPDVQDIDEDTIERTVHTLRELFPD